MTESGIIHQMKKACPDKTFIPAPPDNGCACNECPYMRLNTLEKVYLCMRDRRPEITLPEDLRLRALVPLERMLEMSAADAGDAHGRVTRSTCAARRARRRRSSAREVRRFLAEDVGSGDVTTRPGRADGGARARARSSRASRASWPGCRSRGRCSAALDPAIAVSRSRVATATASTPGAVLAASRARRRRS